MLFLTCDVELSDSARERIRKEIEGKTGEACVILDGGRFSIQNIPVMNDK